MSSFASMTDDRSLPHVRIPRSALAMLSHRCAAIGNDGVQALREAGYRAGSSLAGSMAPDPAALDRDAFWAALDRVLAEAGLGSISFESVSPALGAVAWHGSPEAGGLRSDRAGERCHFAAGLLGGVLSRTARGTVDVMEIRCGAGGDQPCWFLFGALPAIRAVQERRAAGDRRAAEPAAQP